VSFQLPNPLSKRHSLKKTCLSDSGVGSSDLQDERGATKCGEGMLSRRRNSAPDAHSAQSRSASSQRRRGSAPAVLAIPAQWNPDEPDLFALLAKLQTVEDFYRVLQVDDDAAVEKVARAYKKLKLKFHPDLHPDQSETPELIFKIISKAYDTLHDSSKRRAYDRARAEANQNIENQSLSPDVILRKAEMGEDVAARCCDAEDFPFGRQLSSTRPKFQKSLSRRWRSL